MERQTSAVVPADPSAVWPERTQGGAAASDPPEVVEAVVPREAGLKTDKIDLAQCEPLAPVQILARVGSDIILAGEVTGAVNEMLAPYREKYPESALEREARKLTQMLLQRRINAKLVYQDVQRKMPEQALENFRNRLSEEFEEREIPRRLENLGLSSRRELELELSKIGTTLEREKEAFIEAIIAQQWLQQQAEENPDTVLPEISPDELLAYYHEHIEDYEHPARVRWQQLTIKKRPNRPDHQEYAMLAELGNRVLQGEPFETVAKEASEGPTAVLGGRRDWTLRGGLKSEKLDEALFTLPVGKLSPIMEDESGFHIIRVLQREEAHRTPFVDAQLEIRKAIKAERRKEVMQKYVAKLKQEIPVWTVFDQQRTATDANAQAPTRR